MTSECLALILKGRVARASRSRESQLSFAINNTVGVLLDGVKDKTEDQRLNYASTLCHAVARSTSPRKIFELLKMEPDIAGSHFNSSQHLLAAAVAIEDIDRVQLLLSEDPREHASSAFFGFFGEALQNAARTGREDILKLLIESYPHTPSNPNVPDAIAQAFTAACTSGHASIVHFLLDSYSEANSMHTFDYEEAIIAAANHGHVALVQTLLQRFIRLDNHNVLTKAAFAAASRGYPLVVQMLLTHSLDVNVVSHEGQNLLHHAARGGHARVVELLLDHGVSYYEGQWGDPLYLAAINGHEDVVQLLLDHGADINAKGRDYCVLARAAKNGESPMIRFLVERGVDVHARDCGDVALEVAAERGHDETVRLLVGMGVDVDGCNRMDSPMLRAMMYGQQCVVNTLLELGAKKVDPLETEYANDFLDGEYPMTLRV